MKKGLSTIVFLGLIATGPAGARADAAVSSETMSFFRQEAEAIYAAARHRQTAKNAPASVIVITHHDFENHGYRTVAEALQGEAGIYAADDRNYSYHWIRGVGLPDDYNNRILLLINGHRINENIYGSSSFDHMFPVDVHAIKQIEVVKGPGSALYGNNAFFAVINVITLDPQEAAGAQTNVEGGSFGTRKLAAIASVQRGESGVMVSGAGRIMDGQAHHYAEFESINGGVASDSDEEKSGSAFAAARHKGLSIQAGYNKRRKEIPTASFGTVFNNDPPNQTRDTRSFAEVKSDHRLSPDITMNARLYFDRYTFDGDVFFENDSAPPAVVRYGDREENEWWGEEVVVRWAAANGRTSLTVGQDYESTSTLSVKAAFDLPNQATDGFKDASSRYSFFAQTELAPVHSLALTAGVRYDRYTTFKGTLNPRLAAVLALRERTSLKVVYGTAFRAPTPYERLYNTFENKQNLNLQPETIETFETHLIEEIGRNAAASVGYFHSMISDLITASVDPLDGLMQFVNGAGAHSTGLEAGFHWAPQPRSRLRFGYTLQETSSRGGGRLSNSPQHTGHLSVSHALAPNLSLASNLVVIGERRAEAGVLLRSNELVGAGVTYRPKGGPIRLYVNVFNLFNDPFYQSASGEHVQRVIRQNGRNYNAGVEVRFGE